MAERSRPVRAPPTSSKSSAPAAVLPLPTLTWKPETVARARHGRLGRQHGSAKISPQHSGGTTPSFYVEDPKSNNGTLSHMGGGSSGNFCASEETRPLFPVRTRYDRVSKVSTPATVSQLTSPVGRGTANTLSSLRTRSLAKSISTEGVRKGAVNVPSEFSSQATDVSRRLDQQQQSRVVVAAEFDPTKYVSLLPATGKLQKAGDMQNRIVVGTTAKELLAERGIMRSDRYDMSNASKRVQGVPMLELRQFEAKMKALKDRERNVCRRWRRRPSLGAVGKNSNIIMAGDDDSSTDSGGTSVDSTSSTSTETREQEQLQRRREGVAAAAARRERIKMLQLHGEGAHDKIVLRNEIQKSRMEVEKARNGITTATLLHSLGYLLKDRSSKEASEGDRKATQPPREGVSWGNEASVFPGRASLPPIPRDTPQRAEKTNNSASPNHGDRRLSLVFHDILHRARGTMVYGLYPADTQRKQQRRRRQKQPIAMPGTTPSPSPSPLCNSERVTPLDSLVPISRIVEEKQLQHCSSKEESHRRHRPLPVEFGVGERSRQVFDAQVQEQRIDDLQKELEHGEDILRTRKLLVELLPERINLLDDSFGESYEHANIVLERHRQKLFKMAGAIQAEERKEACLALVNLLENSYRNEIAETTWPAVMNALHKTRDLILVSPNRCNVRSFHFIIKEYFLLPHLLEGGVDDILRRLSQLFDMTKSQYKHVMANIFKQLNQPRNYQTRFREIERTILGKHEIPEKRYRITLYCCRFLLSFANMGLVLPTTTPTTTTTTPITSAVASVTHTAMVPTACSGSVTGMSASSSNTGVGVRMPDVQGALASGSELIRRERGPERLKISVQLTSDHQNLISEVVSAHIKESAGIMSICERSTSDEKLPYYRADLRRQSFYVQLYENSLLEVSVLRSGVAIASGALRFGDCKFDMRGTALLWLRLTGGTCLQAEIKLRLEVLYEKERVRRITKVDSYR